jgi:hypothetical protein
MRIYFVILIIFLSGCSTQYLIGFKPNEISSRRYLYETINNSGNPSGLTISFRTFYNNRLKNIEYINGWVKIGNELFTFNKDEIRIGVQTADSPSSVLVFFLYEENGKMAISEEEKLKILHDCYYMNIFKAISKREFKKIYKQENKSYEIYFEYKVTVDDEMISMIINETSSYDVTKRLWFLGEILLKEETLE